MIKPVLFRIDPEVVHNHAIATSQVGGEGRLTWLTRMMRPFFVVSSPKIEQTLAGISFKNPVGLSAGFDKNAELVGYMPDIGFGFQQVGTVTYSAYEGNSGTRLYRLPKSEGIVVYYGLKNDGVHVITKRFNKLKQSGFPYGISVGKTNSPEVVSLEAGAQDYVDALKVLVSENAGDFYTLNISCPNTFGGEPFTDPESLELLLQKVEALKLATPVFIKMPIDLGWNDFQALLDVILQYSIDGLVLSNLTKDFTADTICDVIPEHIKGGISGKPTKDLSTELIRKTYAYCGDKLILVGVGGISSAEDAYEKIRAGASLVQLITGMIYKGPQLVGEINAGLVKLLERDCFEHIGDAVGADVNY